MEQLEKSIGYTFKDKNLLKNALTHTSYAYEHHVDSNEKLEFLGDSILEFLSSKYIYSHYPHLKEGEMTKVRAEVVCEDSLYIVAQKHHFSGLEEAEKFIVTNLAEAVEASSKNVGMKDHKTVLQEKLQEHGTVHINYEVIKTSGPDHDKSFTVEVYCDGKALAIGEGKTKKQAEMQAAERALEKLA